MANISARLLKINGTDITNICEYSVQYNKLWADADRNMAGEVRATLIGIFPKIVVKTTVQEINKVMTMGTLLNTPYFSVTYFDFITNTTKTANYYASDFEVKLKTRRNSLVDVVSFSLVPVSKA